MIITLDIEKAYDKIQQPFTIDLAGIRDMWDMPKHKENFKQTLYPILI